MTKVNTLTAFKLTWKISRYSKEHHQLRRLLSGIRRGVLRHRLRRGLERLSHSLGANTWAVYRDPAIIKIDNYQQHATQQQLIDDINAAIDRN